MKYLLLNLLLVVAYCAHSQDYLIRHDLLKEKTEYFRISRQKDTIKVNSINMKRAASIKLEVQNFNPFYWNAKVTTYKKPLDEQVGFAAVFNPIAGLAKSILGSALPNLQLPEFGSRGEAGSSTIDRFLSATSALTKQYEELRALEIQYDEWKLLEMELNELKYEHTRTEADIKKAAQTLVSKNIDLDLSQLEQVLASGKQKDMQFQNAVDSIPVLQEQLQKLGAGLQSDMVVDEGFTVKDVLEKAGAARKAVNNISIGRSSNDRSFTEELFTISRLYRDINNTPFYYHYLVNSEPDITELKLEVFPRKDSLSKDTIVKYFPVHSRGNVRIRNSFGVAFAYFSSNKEYFVKPDLTIGQSSADLFTPILSTLIHFYPATLSGLKWGGAFGFGIPLQGTNKDINFLLGPSAIIGRNELIIITAGAVGGRVTKLSGGWKVGEQVPSSSFTVPTKSFYDIGLFASVSFNVGSLNIGKGK